MKTICSFLLVLLTVAAIAAQNAGPAADAAADPNLSFEKVAENAKLPDAWMQWGSGYQIKIDRAEKKSGDVSVSFEPADGRADGSFSAIARQLPANYAGKEIELRGYLKFADVAEGYGGLFMRIDGEDGVLQFDNMNERGLKGTTDWAEYSIKLPLPENGTALYVGALLTGKGKLWVDDLRVYIDGRELKEAKTRAPVVFKAALDKEFDAGSKIEAVKLDKDKIEDLAALGQVWGFLKYHHPAIAGGEYNWDYELFRVLPKVIAAKGKSDRNKALLEWIKSLGAVQPGPPPPVSPLGAKNEVKLQPDLRWIEPKTFGKELVAALNEIRDARRAEKHYYIGFAQGVRNPQFKNEAAYKTMAYPDTGYRLLSLYRYWNVIQYYFPNRHLIEEDWNKVLAEFVPGFVNAANELEYKKSALALIARIHDTHANIWGQDATLKKFRGANTAPVNVTFVEDKAVVTHYWDTALGEKSGLKAGDAIESVNGQKVSEIIKKQLKFTPASNYPTQLRDIARYLLNTNDEFLNVTYTRDGATKELRLDAYAREKFKNDFGDLFARKTAPFKLIESDIAYLYPGALKPGDIQKLLPEIAKTKGLVVDLRSYPSDFIVFSVGEFLHAKPVDFVRFSNGSIARPGLFTYTEPLKVGKENASPYKGKLVILINEITQSQAEYTTMALRTVLGAVVIGSTTAGADGNVSQFSLPGGISTMISGIGVYYPDGKETQRVGIVPDINVKPTLKGIREGRDELLERAVAVINGTGK